jgi:membrane-bound lytic murein transglycosylase F
LPTPGKSQALIVLIAPGPLTHETGRALEAPDTDPLAGDDAPDEGAGIAVSGLEYDLARMFARSLGVPVRFVVTPPHRFEARLRRHEAHLAIGWLTPDPDAQGVIYGAPYLESVSILVRHEKTPPLRRPEKLQSQIVVAAEGSHQYRALLELQRAMPTLRVEAFPTETQMSVLEAVAGQKVAYALVDKSILDVGLNFYPMLQTDFTLGAPYSIAWMFPADGDPEVFRRAQAFIASAREGAIARLHDRYLGHVKRLDANDVTTFIARIRTLLPRYRTMFEEAGRGSDLDWRLLAALAYQESHWNPLNTSPTGVRGMMMLTTETADRLGVRNRLDPRESILAGARYVDFLKSSLPASTQEPDRTWQALAAYNIGPGHFSAARAIARQLKVDGDSWFEMKKVLPLLARPRYYSRLKSGRARGGEAVILVENVRMYYDILRRHTTFAPLEQPREEHGTGIKPPAQLPKREFVPLEDKARGKDMAPAS